ncbi:MAG: B12-binding domain-containing radical SAM protein [Desulfuromonadaceae bacterium]
MLSVLLIAPKTTDIQLPLPPLGLYYLAGPLIAGGIRTTVYDLSIDDESHMVSEILVGKYDMIGMSVSHVDMRQNLDDLWKYRKAGDKSDKKVLFIAGGHAATYNPKLWLDTGLIDVIFTGFAQESLTRFCQSYQELKSQHGETVAAELSAKHIAGVAFIDRNNNYVSIPSEKLNDHVFKRYFSNSMSNIIIPYERYSFTIDESDDTAIDVVSLYTTSHCQGGCGFCGSQNFIKTSQRSPSNIYYLSAEEIFEMLISRCHESSNLYILFLDEDFMVGNKSGRIRTVDLCNMILKAKDDHLLPANLKLSCQSKAMNFMVDSVVDSHTIELMAKTGFCNVGIGIETFSDRLLGSVSINKKNASSKSYQIVLDELIKYGVYPTIYLILGIPNSSADDIVESMHISLKYMTKGAFVRISNKMDSQPGSPLTVAGCFETVFKSWHHQKCGCISGIPDYFVPLDSDVRNMIDNLWEVKKNEITALKDEYMKFAGGIRKSQMELSKQLGVCGSMIAALKLLRREDKVPEFIRLVEVVATRYQISSSD